MNKVCSKNEDIPTKMGSFLQKTSALQSKCKKIFNLKLKIKNKKIANKKISTENCQFFDPFSIKMIFLKWRPISGYQFSVHNLVLDFRKEYPRFCGNFCRFSFQIYFAPTWAKFCRRLCPVVLLNSNVKWWSCEFNYYFTDVKTNFHSDSSM